MKGHHELTTGTRTTSPQAAGHRQPANSPPGTQWRGVRARLRELTRNGVWSHALVLHVSPDNLHVSEVLSGDGDLFQEMLDALVTSGGELSEPLSQVLREPSVLIVDDVDTDPRIPADHREFYQSLKLASFVAVPLGFTLGILILGKTEPIVQADVVAALAHTATVGASMALELDSRRAEFSPDEGSQERDWLWLMLNAVSDPIIVSDPRNRVLYFNSRASLLLNQEGVESSGRLRAIEMNNFLLSAALSSFALGHGADLAREFTLVDPMDGSELLFEVISGPVVQTSAGEPGQVFVLRDVTDMHKIIEELRDNLDTLKDAHESLRRERDQFALVLEHAVDPKLVSDPDGNIVLASQSALQFLRVSGQRSEPAVERPSYYANEAEIASLVLKVRLDPSMIHRELVNLVHPDTLKLVPFQATLAAVKDEFGQISAILCVLHDLTTVRELENRQVREQLFESEKMAAMGRLGAAMAHEINNPLEAVQNSLYLLDMNLPKDMPDRQYLDIAYAEIQRVSRIIRQMLGLYRPKSEMELVSLNRIAEDAVNLLTRHLRGRRLALRQNLSLDVRPVMASADQMRQVLLNLMLNAADATGEGGSIEISTRRSKGLGNKGRGTHWTAVEIRDSGHGIAPDVIDRIFEPFFSTKEGGQGTGIGLWITRDIVEQHGGQIEVESSPERGSKFTVHLPVAPEDT